MARTAEEYWWKESFPNVCVTLEGMEDVFTNPIFFAKNIWTLPKSMHPEKGSLIVNCESIKKTWDVAELKEAQQISMATTCYCSGDTGQNMTLMVPATPRVQSLRFTLAQWWSFLKNPPIFQRLLLEVFGIQLWHERPMVSSDVLHYHSCRFEICVPFTAQKMAFIKEQLHKDNNRPRAAI